ncbi:MAG: NADH-quinone oxidoreductase subunit [Thermoleophilaceae bacterium]|nr:NADH-quinone oxidoreductase subunit [Thermoleophilaceae bacterium]MEA2353804.1 NADH-quinone oxidoreductase subunit [Thermoleophilaceae bacterium]MEA2368530.1 NADH-quinone oxidoreductase subunit [Thermoleophilaceae bacterium]
MPDATGLELIAAAVRDRLGDDSVAGTSYFREQATLEVPPESVHDAIAYLKDEADEPFELLMSLHGCDYFPAEPRLAVHYQLLSMERIDRLGVKTRLGADEPALASVVDLFPGADFQEREVYDMFGVVFDGHPDLRRILMPEDYEGFPQRRDFPIGGEPVLFTFNEHELPRWYE